MKSFVALIFAVALVEFASAVSKEYHDKMIAAKDKCAKEHNIEESVIQDFLREKKLPETDQGKCLIACYLEEMKLLVDGKPAIEEWKSSNKEKWEEPEIVAKADQLADKCSGEVSADGKNKCDYAIELLKCGLKYGKEMGIPTPDLKNPKRR